MICDAHFHVFGPAERYRYAGYGEVPRHRRMHEIGVRGVRINVNPVKPPEPGFSTSMLARIAALDERCAARGWVLDFLTPGWLTRELMPTLAKLKSRTTLAHMGMFAAAEPVPTDFVDFVRKPCRGLPMRRRSRAR